MTKKKGRVLLVLTLLALPLFALCFSRQAGAATCAAMPTDKGSASVSFTVDSAGTYRLWAHLYAPSSSGNTLALAFDSDCSSLSVGGGTAKAGAFAWLGYAAGTTNPVSVNLASGSHVITIAGQAPNVGVDRILLTADSSCTPTGDGSNCVQSLPVASSSPTPKIVSVSTKSTPPQMPSIAKVGAYAAAGALLAELLSWGVIHFVRRRQQSPLMTTSGGNLMPSQSGWRGSSAAVVVLSVVGGMAGVAMVLAGQSSSIMIDLSNAKVSGEARLVANAQAVTGHMVQFGAGTAPSVSKTPTPSATPKSSKPASGTTGSTSAGTTASTSPSPVVSSCTNPSWSTSEATGTDPIGNDDVWWIDNDAWNGSHGPQSLYVCSPSSWYAVSNQTNHGGAVETYPSSEYDVAGRGNATKTIAQYKSITSTFSENFPSAGSWDAAYDLWLNDWSTEIMIWNEWTGTQLYWPDNKSVTVTLGGVPYWFQDLGGEYIFYRQNMVKSGSVDILAAFNYLVSKGLVKSTDVPTQLEYGVEVCSTNGNETFPLTGLTFTLN